MIELTSAEPGQLTPVGFLLRDGIAFDDWLKIGGQLARIERSYRWWVGDWLRYGERAYGDRYEQAIASTGLDYSSVTSCKYVASSVDFCRRRQNLSWSHHELVAPLEAAGQEKWLSRAEAETWTREQLRANIRGPKPLPEATEPVAMPLLRFCQPDLPTPTIVALILRVAFPDAQTGLDLTYGNGAFWDGSAHIQVTAHDANAARAPDGVVDFRRLEYADGTFDVSLFDPPHVADAGAASIMGQRFGTAAEVDLQLAIARGVCEAWRVARLGIIVKITDHVHGQRFVSETDWVREALGGQLPYDVVHQTRSGALVDPRWEDQRSAYNNGSTYLIFRKGSPFHIRRKGAS